MMDGERIPNDMAAELERWHRQVGITPESQAIPPHVRTKLLHTHGWAQHSGNGDAHVTTYSGGMIQFQGICPGGWLYWPDDTPPWEGGRDERRSEPPTTARSGSHEA